MTSIVYRVLAVLAAGIVSASAVYAQADVSPTPPASDARVTTETLYGIGGQAGLFSGSGLMFRMNFPNRMGAQAAFGIIKLGDNTYWSVGGEFHYSFDANTEDHFYGLLGAGYYYAATNDSSGNELDSPVRLGFGLGYEWFISRNVVFNVTLPIIFFTGDESTILPIPQAAIVYYFR